MEFIGIILVISQRAEKVSTLTDKGERHYEEHS
jgi:hypothetical protein